MKILVLNGGKKNDRGQPDICVLLASEILSQGHSVDKIDLEGIPIAPCTGCFGAAPLYVDSLPSGVTRLFEILAAEHSGKDWLGGKQFVALINCGFPEARQCETAVAICRCFARETGMEWAGGLSLGGGEAIGGKKLSEAGGVAGNARKALDMAAEALAVGRPVPGGAVSLMAAPAVSTWLFTLMGDFGWRLKARRHGTGSRLKDRPHRR